MNNYNEEYFNSNNYASYLERHERYERMMQELHHDLFRRIKFDVTKQPVLDFGCAVGFNVCALLNLGYTDVVGYDVSEWAINWGKDNLGLKEHLISDIHSYRKTPELLLSLDVFEHMSEIDIRQTLLTLAAKHVLVRIPLSLETNGKYVLSVSERDKTHVIRWTRKDWLDFFKFCGYDWQYDINLGLIYDTSGVMCSMFRAKPFNVYK